jgi:Na+/phosphate symporter
MNYFTGITAQFGNVPNYDNPFNSSADFERDIREFHSQEKKFANELKVFITELDSLGLDKIPTYASIIDTQYTATQQNYESVKAIKEAFEAEYQKVLEIQRDFNSSKEELKKELLNSVKSEFKELNNAIKAIDLIEINENTERKELVKILTNLTNSIKTIKSFSEEFIKEIN